MTGTRICGECESPMMQVGRHLAFCTSGRCSMYGRGVSLGSTEDMENLVQLIERGIENTSSTDRERALDALHTLAIIADRVAV